MIIQNVSQDGTTDVTFTVEKESYAKAAEIASIQDRGEAGG